MRIHGFHISEQGLTAELAARLSRIVAIDRAVEGEETHYESRRELYEERATQVYMALCLASLLGYPVGFRIDQEETDWPVAFLTLPTGQISWHMPAHPEPWDGHTTEVKHARIAAFVGDGR